MLITAVLAFVGGALLGTRFNVWALLLCLGGAVLLMTGTTSLTSYSLASTTIATFVVVTAAQIGYLAGTYATQAGVLRRALRLASLSIR
jgi:hypothetical protein